MIRILFWHFSNVILDDDVVWKIFLSVKHTITYITYIYISQYICQYDLWYVLDILYKITWTVVVAWMFFGLRTKAERVWFIHLHLSFPSHPSFCMFPSQPNSSIIHRKFPHYIGPQPTHVILIIILFSVHHYHFILIITALWFSFSWVPIDLEFCRNRRYRTLLLHETLYSDDS